MPWNDEEEDLDNVPKTSSMAVDGWRHRQLRSIANNRGISLAALTREMIDKFLIDQNRKAEK